MEQGLEYFGVLTGLLYLGLEIVQHRAMWIVGFVTSFVYIFVFFFSKFYADMSLNIYYVCISIYGFWQWHKGKAVQEGTEVLILYRRLNIRLIWGNYCRNCFFVRYVVFHFVGLYRFARIGRRCFYHSFEYYGNVDAGPENIGTLVVLGGDRRGVGIVVLSAGFVSDLLFICMLWRISDCRMDQLEKERKVV